MRMPPPMGLGSKANGTDVVRFVFALDIPLVDGKVGGNTLCFNLYSVPAWCACGCVLSMA